MALKVRGGNLPIKRPPDQMAWGIPCQHYKGMLILYRCSLSKKKRNEKNKNYSAVLTVEGY